MAIVTEDFTLAIPLRAAPANAQMELPESKKLPGGELRIIRLVAGMHTIQLLWRGTATSLSAQVADGLQNGRVVATLPGGETATPVTINLVIPPGGLNLFFVQDLAITAQQAVDSKHALGVNAYLSPAHNA